MYGCHSQQENEHQGEGSAHTNSFNLNPLNELLDKCWW